MSEYKDRGIMKWAPFDALDGHGSMLEEMIYNINKKEKAKISDDENEEINQELLSALNNKKPVSIDYYFDGYTYNTFGKISKIKELERELVLDTGETIEFDQILRLKVEKQ